MNNLIFVRNILHSSFLIGQNTTEALEFMTEQGNLSIEYVNGDINISIRPDSFIHTSLSGHVFSFLHSFQSFVKGSIKISIFRASFAKNNRASDMQANIVRLK